MTFGRRTPEPFDSAEAAQLQRDVVATVLHGLGSITSALALRVDASRQGFAERDVHAVAALTEQLRAATRPLIWLRGSPGRGALSPERALDVAVWWQHTAQVVYALLPRGTHVRLSADATPPDANALPSADLTLFAMLILGSCRHIVDLDARTALILTVTLPHVASSPFAVVMELTTFDGVAIPLLATRMTRWRRFCARTAARAGATLAWWEPIPNANTVYRLSIAKHNVTL